MGHHHDALRSLCPVKWSDVPQQDLRQFLENHVTEAYTVIDSIPSPTTPASPTAAATAAATPDPAASPDPSIPNTRLIRGQWPAPEAAEQSAQLRREWKEVKVNPRENPLGIQVHKLPGKDGRGAWFARRSIHQGLTFDQWRDGMQCEFMESIKVQEGPGSGAIRGIGADRRVEHHVVPDLGTAQVFQLSAQFPGPTSPRDFITLLLSSEFSIAVPRKHRPLRQYIVVSKPCDHPECPPRQGIIRGQYESVELVREVPLENFAAKRSLSSADLGSIKTPKLNSMTKSTISLANGDEDDSPVAIEWLMVTRSDPGGSVPRFMIEKGTPPGIVNDAGKFLDWITPKPDKNSQPEVIDSKVQAKDSVTAPAATSTVEAKQAADETGQQPLQTEAEDNQEQSETKEVNSAGSNGLWGMVTGAFGAAGWAVSGGLRRQLTTAEDLASDSDSQPLGSPDRDAASEGEAEPSDTSSMRSFASALEQGNRGDFSVESNAASTSDTRSEGKRRGKQENFKQLRRLEERSRKLDAKVAKITESMEAKRLAGQEKEAAALAKSREKHEKEIAKQEAKYKKELRRIEEKREQSERKAEQRRIKAAERQEKTNMVLELEKVRAERDVALKKVDVLVQQIGELQAENTKLVANMSRPTSAREGEPVGALGLDKADDTLTPRKESPSKAA